MKPTSTLNKPIRQKGNIWAYYLNNGSIERRNASPEGKLMKTYKEAKTAYPFQEWFSLRILKIVRKTKEKKEEICPNNSHAHHLLSKCPFCKEKVIRGDL